MNCIRKPMISWAPLGGTGRLITFFRTDEAISLQSQSHCDHIILKDYVVVPHSFCTLLVKSCLVLVFDVGGVILIETVAEMLSHGLKQ